MAKVNDNDRLACSYKFRFETFSQANATNKRGKYKVYKCPACNGYHHASKR